MINQQTTKEMLKCLLTKTDTLKPQNNENGDRHKYHQNRNCRCQ